MSSFTFISRGAAHTKRRERPLLRKEGTIPGILLAIRNSRKLLGSLTCRKAGTWDRFFYFPFGGRHAEDFYVPKIQRLLPGLNPQTWVPEASMLTTRPPKPSSTHCRCRGFLLHLIKLGDTHTHTRTHTLGRTPLDGGSGSHRGLCMTTHNTYNRQMSMPPPGFEFAIRGSKRPQTHVLDRAATGIGINEF